MYFFSLRYLQHGSYPVMSLQNASYPDNFAMRRLFLHNITLFSDTVPVLINITNPFSGNWYAAAFLIENTDRIAQKVSTFLLLHKINF